MRIPCPWCGPRSSDEFTYLGDASVRRPTPDAGPDAWVDYVYFRDNPAGPIKEYWHHGSGCRQWLVVERDTRDHKIMSAAPARERGENGS